MDITSESKWLVLLHSLPPKPDYLRVRIRRRLLEIGTVPLKSAAYVLPESEEAFRALEEVRGEIEKAGGTAVLMAAQFVAGVDVGDLVATFNAQSARRYVEITGAAREALADHHLAQKSVAARLLKKLTAERARDRFGAVEGLAAEAALAELDQQIRAAEAHPTNASEQEGATWVTRRDVFVDRLASAWLIHRFIDRTARFKFVAGQGYQPQPGEIRFDMFEGGYSHRGDQCTFEVLIETFGFSHEPALAQIAQIVHDLDLRDDKYGRAEAPGIRVMLEGLVARYASDAERVEHGRRVFDQLYSRFARQAGP